MKPHEVLTDDSPVNTSELAQLMRCSRWMIGRHKREGYRFEFGFRTTAGHYKAWLRKHVAEADTLSAADAERMERQLAKLRGVGAPVRR